MGIAPCDLLQAFKNVFGTPRAVSNPGEILTVGATIFEVGEDGRCGENALMYIERRPVLSTGFPSEQS